MAGMGMSLRVVVPPHPLIGHWLTLLRDRHTPSPLFATALAELGRWLTYEALRDWLPERVVTVETPLALAEGRVIDAGVPLLAVPVLRAGLGLWQGAQQVLPQAQVCHVGLQEASDGDAPQWFLDTLPPVIGERMGVLVFVPLLASGRTLLAVLERLGELGVSGARLRVITSLAAAPGLRLLGERFEDLSIYCACIDPELDDEGQLRPGCGEIAERLYGTVQSGFLG
jgi:uracil phosphoribosyltransferase